MQLLNYLPLTETTKVQLQGQANEYYLHSVLSFFSSLHVAVLTILGDGNTLKCHSLDHNSHQ